jgi:hypothetical protein
VLARVRATPLFNAERVITLRYTAAQKPLSTARRRKRRREEELDKKGEALPRLP